MLRVAHSYLAQSLLSECRKARNGAEYVKGRNVKEIIEVLPIKTLYSVNAESQVFT